MYRSRQLLIPFFRHGAGVAVIRHGGVALVSPHVAAPAPPRPCTARLRSGNSSISGGEGAFPLLGFEMFRLVTLKLGSEYGGFQSNRSECAPKEPQ